MDCASCLCATYRRSGGLHGGMRCERKGERRQGFGGGRNRYCGGWYLGSCMRCSEESSSIGLGLVLLEEYSLEGKGRSDVCIVGWKGDGVANAMKIGI